jgi:hypothetical protein
VRHCTVAIRVLPTSIDRVVHKKASAVYLSLESVECTLWILMTAVRTLGLGLLCADVVRLVLHGKIPLFDPLDWLATHKGRSLMQCVRVN